MNILLFAVSLKIGRTCGSSNEDSVAQSGMLDAEGVARSPECVIPRLGAFTSRVRDLAWSFSGALPGGRCIWPVDILPLLGEVKPLWIHGFD